MGAARVVWGGGGLEEGNYYIANTKGITNAQVNFSSLSLIVEVSYSLTIFKTEHKCVLLSPVRSVALTFSGLERMLGVLRGPRPLGESSRRCDRQLACELDVGDQILRTPSPVFGTWVLLAFPTSRAFSKDKALRR